MAKEKMVEIKHEWVDLYKYGYSTEHIGKEYNVSATMVQNGLLKRGIRLRYRGKKITEKDHCIWLRMFERGYCLEAMARRTKCSTSSVSLYLKSRGLSTNKRYISDENKKLWLEMYKKGITIEEIAEECDYHAGTVWAYLAEVECGAPVKGIRYKKGYSVYSSGANKGRAVHRVIIEEHLDRKLKREEVVHHIDGNSLNNDISNLMVFSSGRSHTKFHALQAKRDGKPIKNISSLGHSL